MHVPVTPLGLEKVLHGHLPAADERTGIVVIRIDPPAAPQRDARAANVAPRSRGLDMPTVTIEGLPADGHPLLAGAIALQLLTLELVHAAGTNPDLIRREERAYRGRRGRREHVSGAPRSLASLLWGTADFLAGRASRAHPAAMVALVGQAVGLVALALVLALPRRGQRRDRSRRAAPALLGVVGVLAFYRALALGTMSIVAPIVATSAIVPVAAGVCSTASGRARCSGSAWSPRWPASCWPPSSPAAHAARRQAGAQARARSPRSRSGSRSSSSTRRPSTTRSPASAAARGSSRSRSWRDRPAQRARAPLRELPQARRIGLLDTGANTRVRDRHHRRPAEPRRRARRAVPGRHRRARLLPAPRAPAADAARRRDPRARRHPADQRIGNPHRLLASPASGRSLAT